jgi:hypothetical protein
MQLLNARVAAGQAFSTGHVAQHAKRSARPAQRRGLTSVSVSATAEPVVELDRDAAYKTFESLLDEYTVSFATGDKVRGRQNGARAGSGYWFERFNWQLT